MLRRKCPCPHRRLLVSSPPFAGSHVSLNPYQDHARRHRKYVVKCHSYRQGSRKPLGVMFVLVVWRAFAWRRDQWSIPPELILMVYLAVFSLGGFYFDPFQLGKGLYRVFLRVSQPLTSEIPNR